MRTRHWDYCKIPLKQLLKASCSSVKSSAFPACSVTVKRSPYGVLIDGLIEEQDVEAEDANQQGMERGHSPAETQKTEVLSHDNSVNSGLPLLKNTERLTAVNQLCVLHLKISSSWLFSWQPAEMSIIACQFLYAYVSDFERQLTTCSPQRNLLIRRLTGKYLKRRSESSEDI